jgi:hypothetical protein
MRLTTTARIEKKQEICCPLVTTTRSLVTGPKNNGHKRRSTRTSGVTTTYRDRIRQRYPEGIDVASINMGSPKRGPRRAAHRHCRCLTVLRCSTQSALRSLFRGRPWAASSPWQWGRASAVQECPSRWRWSSLTNQVVGGSDHLLAPTQAFGDLSSERGGPMSAG